MKNRNDLFTCKAACFVSLWYYILFNLFFLLMDMFFSFDFCWEGGEGKVEKVIYNHCALSAVLYLYLHLSLITLPFSFNTLTHPPTHPPPHTHTYTPSEKWTPELQSCIPFPVKDFPTPFLSYFSLPALKTYWTSEMTEIGYDIFTPEVSSLELENGYLQTVYYIFSSFWRKFKSLTIVIWKGQVFG